MTEVVAKYYVIYADYDSETKEYLKIDDALEYISKCVDDGNDLNDFTLIKGESLNLKNKVVVE